VPLYILRAWLPESGLHDGRVHALVAAIGWIISRAIDRVYFDASLKRYQLQIISAPYLVKVDGSLQFQTPYTSLPHGAPVVVPLAHALLSANLGLGACWSTHKTWPHARIIKYMSDRTKLSSGTFFFVVFFLFSCWSAAILSVRAAFWCVVTIVWCAGVWAICLLDTYQADEAKENDAGLVCRRDPLSGQLVELTQCLHTTHKHGVHMRRANPGEPWSLQSYFFHVRHGAELS